MDLVVDLNFRMDTSTSVVPSLSTPAAMSRSRPFRVVTIWTTMPGVRKTARSRSTTPLALTITVLG